MALTRTAADLETGARERADMIGSNFRSQATIFRYLSKSCRALVAMLAELSDASYWAEEANISTIANNRFSDQPADMWKLLKLRATINGERVKFHKATSDQLDAEVTLTGWLEASRIGYRLRGSKLVWAPTPTAVHTVTVEYVPTTIFRTAAPAPTAQLTATTDTFDGIFGWDDWVEIHTAIRLKNDQGKDTASLLEELGRTQALIIAAAKERDGEAPRSRDTWRSGADAEDYP